MPDSTINQKPIKAILDGTEEYAINNSGEDRRVNTDGIKEYAIKTLATQVLEISSNVSPAVENIDYLINANAQEILMGLPTVSSGDRRRYYLTLKDNSNHCNVTVIGGQLIGGKSILSLSTVNARVIVVANGVDGYDIISDERSYYRNIPVTDSITLLTGVESGALYECRPLDAVELVITIQNWSTEHVGDWAKFIKATGVNSSVRIVSQDATFDEVILDNDTGFKLTYGSQGFIISQDSRKTASLVTLDFYPTTAPSAIEPTYNKLVNNSEDPDYDDPAVIFSTPPITSEIEQSIGVFLNDAGALTALISERGLNAYAQVKLQASGNRSAAIKFKYYEYDLTTGLNPTPLTETAFSEFILGTELVQKFIGGLLPSNSWSNKLLAVELIARKSASGGDNPIVDFSFGGATPSKTSIDLPATGIAHDTLSAISTANLGVSKGHIDNKYPLVFPTLTTAERDLIATPNTSMKIYNSTTAQYEKYNGSAWVVDGGGGGAAFPEWDLKAATSWDGTNYAPDMTSSDVDQRTVNNGVTVLNFIAPINVSISKGRKKYAVVDNSGNASAITTINFTGYNFAAGSKPLNGMAAGSKAVLELFNNLATVRADWTLDE